MSKLAHSNDETMRKIQSDALLRDDPSLFRCCGCGLASPDEWKPCDCTTGVGYRIVRGKTDYLNFKTEPPPKCKTCGKVL